MSMDELLVKQSLGLCGLVKYGRPEGWVPPSPVRVLGQELAPPGKTPEQIAFEEEQAALAEEFAAEARARKAQYEATQKVQAQVKGKQARAEVAKKKAGA